MSGSALGLFHGVYGLRVWLFQYHLSILSHVLPMEEDPVFCRGHIRVGPLSESMFLYVVHKNVNP